MVFLTDVYCIDWLLIIDRCTGRWTSCRTSPWTTLPPTWCSSQTCTVLIDYWLLIGVLVGEHPTEPRPGQLSHRHGVPHRRVLYWFIDYWLLIGVLAGEHPTEPRPGQLSNRHGVPHRCVLYWFIDYWLLIGVLAGEHPAEPHPGQLSHRHGVPHRHVLYWLIIDYWLLIGVLAGEHPAEPHPGQLSDRHGVPHRHVLYWLIIDYWLPVGVLDWFVDLFIDWLLIGVLAGEHPVEPRPGQLSHRHGVPHRCVLYWLIIDYW